MDYNYFVSAGQQPYNFAGFGDTSFQPDASHDGSGRASSLENPLAAHAFLSGTFDYTNFDANIPTNLADLPLDSNSPSPHQISLLPKSSVDSAISLEFDHEAPGRRGSSEDRENSTPAQSRRKAQNRAAQRAFRERKERHVRDLEDKLNLLTTTASTLQSDNDRLKLLLQRAQTENEILRATAAATSPKEPHPPNFVDDPSSLPQSTRPNHSTPSLSRSTSTSEAGASHFDSQGLAKGLLASSTAPSSPRAPPPTSTDKSVNSPSSTTSTKADPRMLSASATWDLLQSHPLYLAGALDIGKVCERLKKRAKCDGMGPVFDEEEVRGVIEEVGGEGGDAL